MRLVVEAVVMFGLSPMESVLDDRSTFAALSGRILEPRHGQGRIVTMQTVWEVVHGTQAEISWIVSPHTGSVESY